MDSIPYHIDRTQTWWQDGGAAWFAYLSRGSYLLQMGVPDLDFLVHRGDVVPVNVDDARDADLCIGYSYGFTQTDVLLEEMVVENRHLALPDGTRYKALYLRKTEYLTLSTLCKIQALVAQGATVIGQKPKRVIGYGKWNNQQRFDEIATELWGSEDAGIYHYKHGLVSSYSLEASIDKLGYTPGLLLNNEPAKCFVARRVGDNDLYYFYNDKPTFQRIKVDIRDGDGAPEIWHVDDGSFEAISNYTRKSKRLITEIDIEPLGSRFIMIRRDKFAPQYTSNKSAMISNIYRPQAQSLTVKHLNSPWDVQFNGSEGRLGKVRFESLIDWLDHSEESIRHFSGTAIYNTLFLASAEVAKNTRPIYLDLGNVKHIAEITLNGENLGVLWKPPYAIDIRHIIKKGINELKIKVTNTCISELFGVKAVVNSSIHDTADDTVSWVDNNPITGGVERGKFNGLNLLTQARYSQASGLLGPVSLRFKEHDKP